MSEPGESAASATPASTHYIVIHNDDTHTFPYVIKVALLEITSERFAAHWLAQCIDENGLVAIGYPSLDAAEKVRSRILGYGPDRLISKSTGPLTVTVETSIDPLTTPIFGHCVENKFQLMPEIQAELRARIERNVAAQDEKDRELSRLLTGSDDPEEGNYRVHQFAIGCVIVFLILALLAFGASRLL